MKTRECDVGGAVRLPKQFYERPLTLEESRFASEHISIVYRYLRQQGLPRLYSGEVLQRHCSAGHADGSGQFHRSVCIFLFGD